MPSASLIGSLQRSPSHSGGSADLFLRQEAQREPDLSDDEGVLPDTPAFTGLFPDGLFKSLLYKAKVTTGLQESEPAQESSTPRPGSSHGLFSEPVVEQVFIPVLMLFTNIIQKQWASLASLPTPSGVDQRNYNLAPAITQLLQVPPVDNPVAALTSPLPYLSGDSSKGLQPEDKKFELSFKKDNQASAWAIQAATSASFFNRSSLLWLQQLQAQLPLNEAHLHQDLNKIIAQPSFQRMQCSMLQNTPLGPWPHRSPYDSCCGSISGPLTYGLGGGWLQPHTRERN